MSSERFRKKPSVREFLSKRNYHIAVPEEVAKNVTVKKALESKGLKYADTEALRAVAADKVLEEREKWPSVNPNIALLDTNDQQESRRVGIEVSKRKRIVQEGLENEVDFSTTEDDVHLTHKGEKIALGDDVSPVHARLSKFLESSPVIQSLIKEWVDKKAQEGGLLTAGEDAGVDPILFQILTPHLPGDLDLTDTERVEEIIKKQTKILLKETIRRIRAEEKIQAEQREVQIERDSFVWASNPLIAEMRTVARPIILEESKNYKEDGVTEFDLSMQVMMHLPIYDVTEIWQGDQDILRHVQQLVSEEKGPEAEILFQRSLTDGVISPNTELRQFESTRHAKKLADYYRELQVTDEQGNVLELPARYMGDPDINPFKDQERTEIDAQKRNIKTDPVTGERSMEVKEKYSGRTIVFKKISPSMSKLYSLGFSNLHYARDGEIAAYGAFLEDDVFPFAYSAYSPVTRTYTKDMLTHLGIDPRSIIASTRAWNASWAPENTMGTLFAFCHDCLKEEERPTNDGTTPPDPKGVITSINPNLGFKAVSFRGTRFNVAGVKPTSFSYLRNENGTADFMSRSAIREKLGITSDTELEQDPRFLTNKIPFLPTLELLALFNTKQEQDLLRKPIYRVTQEAFDKG